MRISLDDWLEGHVAATTHALKVVAPKPGPKTEPVSSRYLKSLIHPERRVSVPNVKFSPDGTKLLSAGYPSAIVQLWDTTSWKEIRQIQAPRGYRGSADYAKLSPDWSTLYVTANKRIPTRFERDGKPAWKLEFDDEIRRWDLATGKPKPPIKAAGRNELLKIHVTPEGKSLVTEERLPYERGGEIHGLRNAYDLSTGAVTKLADEYGSVMFAPDGKSLAVTVYASPTAGRVLLLDSATGKERARWDAPAERSVMSGAYSPDGKWIYVCEVGNKGLILHLQVFEADTLKHVRAIPSQIGENGYSGFAKPLFTPDGTRVIAIEGSGRVHIVDIKTQKAEHAFNLPEKFRVWHVELSPDGKTLAVNGQPPLGDIRVSEEDTSPEDLPQPRVFLYDLASRKRTEEIVCPHGFWGGLAFSRDGKTLAVGGAGAVHLFDLRTAAKK